MSNGTAKISLLLELKDKISGGLAKAKQYVNQNVAEMKGKLNDLKQSHIEAFKSMGDKIPGFSDAMELLGNPYAMVIAGVLALGAAYGKASDMARDFDSQMAKANVTAQESKTDLAKTSNVILDTASKSTLANATEGSPQAYNILLSAGMEKGTALDTVAPTLEAAKAGFTDVETVAKAAAASMNSSGITDANRLYDILFATLNKGNAEFQDVANYLPKIIPAAKNVGVNMEQVAGSFAYLTAQGQTSERAATLLENTFKVLGDPDKVDAFKKIGVAIYDQQGKVKPMVDIVDQLNVALNGLTDKQRSTVLASLGLDMDSASAFSAMASGADKLRETIDFTTNSTGQFQNAVEAAKTDMDGWNQVSNAIDVAWIKVGEHVNESLGGLGDYLTPILEDILPVIVDFFTGVWDIVSAILEPVGHILGGLIVWLTKSELIRDIAWLIGKAFSLLGDIISGVGTVIEWLYDHTLKPILDAIEWVYSKAKDIIGLGDDAKVVEVKKEVTVGYEQQAIDDRMKELQTNMYKPTNQVQKVLDDEEKKKKKKEDSGTNIRGAEQVRNVTTNIGSIISGDFITQNQQFSNMAPADFQKFLIEIMERYTKSQEMGIN